MPTHTVYANRSGKRNRETEKSPIGAQEEM